MLNVLIVSDSNFSKNVIASVYLGDFGENYFIIECAEIDPGPLNPMVTMMMKLDGYDISKYDNQHSVAELIKKGRCYDIVITVCSKRIDEKCPDFPGQRLRLNWSHPEPDKIAESRIDRIQQIKVMIDNIKVDVLNLINKYEEGELCVKP